MISFIGNSLTSYKVSSNRYQREQKIFIYVLTEVNTTLVNSNEKICTWFNECHRYIMYVSQGNQIT